MRPRYLYVGLMSRRPHEDDSEADELGFGKKHGRRPGEKDAWN